VTAALQHPSQSPRSGRRDQAPCGDDLAARSGGIGAHPAPLGADGIGDLRASEGGAAAAAESVPSVRTSMGALLAGHILRDGEVVLLILKPSMWYIVFSSLRFLAAGLIAVIAAQLGWVHNAHAISSIVYTATFVVAGRVMWAVLQWQGRLYVLTDMRVVRLSGVFNVEILDCALRKVAQTRLTRTFREKLWRLGSIEIIPVDDSCPTSVWQTVNKPAEVQAKIQSTIDRAKQGGFPCGE
jgi:hypothetical protein